MGLPNINIIFQKAASNVIRFSENGIGAIIVRDGGVTAGIYKLSSAEDIATELSSENKAYIERAFIGNVSTPKAIYLYVLAEAAEDVSTALTAFEAEQINYICAPPEGVAADVSEIATWVEGQWDSKNYVRAVLPDGASDFEGIINFTTDDIVVDDTVLTNAEFCSRIMGLILGTPLKMSVTYTVLPEVSDVEHLSRTALDAAVDLGQFKIFHDGEKVKVARGVNSLVTLTEKSADYQKIKIVDTICTIKNDLRMLVEDNYVGKYPNNYDSKRILISAISDYFSLLEQEGILNVGSEVYIDIASQLDYIKNTMGIDVLGMTEQEIKEHPTDSEVFISAVIRILDAIEDVQITITH